MKSKRLHALPPYLFEELEKRYLEAVDAGRDVVNMSIGDPDLEPPDSLRRFLIEALDRPNHHRYPPQRGLPLLKDAIRGYLLSSYGLEARNENILVLIGSKEGIAHLPLAVCDPGDKVLVPEPGYPVYNSAALFAGCRPEKFLLREANDYFPDLEEARGAMLEGARLCFINYPHNPTGAAARGDRLQDLVEWMTEKGIVVANDAAYADVYERERPALLSSIPGILEMPIVEFFSFSKMFSITGWRVGFAVGNEKIIDALAHLKANIDSGVFGALQEAVAKTLVDDGVDYMQEVQSIYSCRRRKACVMLDRLGIGWFDAHATFYLWARVPDGRPSLDFALDLLERANVLVTPGVGFGEGGEGRFRVALTCDEERLEEAGRRMAAVLRGRP